MNIGDTFNISLGYHYGGMVTEKQRNVHKFKVIDIISDKHHSEKDILVCEEVDYGYKECFHRIELEGKLCK